jgi:hypothetical protein
VTTFFLIFALVIVTAILFGVWVVARVVIWIVGAIVGLNRKPPAVQTRVVSALSSCARPNCHAVNPSHARFCRRCGNAIAVGRGAASQPRMRYVA